MAVEIDAHGHDNVTAAHASTFEVTSDNFLTPAGDCILAVGADAVPADVPRSTVEACQAADATIELTLAAGEHVATVRARGDPALTFESDRSWVVRTSDYVDDRTVAVEADAAAADLDRELIGALADGANLSVAIAVDPPA